MTKYCPNLRKYTGSKALDVTLDETSDSYDSEEEETTNIALVVNLIPSSSISA